jgi:hypothetical protein
VRLDSSRPKHDALARLHSIDYFENADHAIRDIVRALDFEEHSKTSYEEGYEDASQPTQAAEGERQVLDVLRILRGVTRFFWLELRDLPVSRDTFTAEMQGRTFSKVKEHLDFLMGQGHLVYRVEHAYNHVADGSTVLNVIVENITT